MDLVFDKSPSLRLKLHLTAVIISLLIASYNLFNAHAAEIVLKDSNLEIQNITKGLKISNWHGVFESK
jgi:hypothetical protein